MSELSKDFVIRMASESDVPEIRKTVRSSIEGIATKDYPKEVTDSWGADTPKAREQQIKAICDGKELTWVAIKDGIIIGFSAFNPKTQDLRAVYVASEFARSGVGSALLKILEKKARELNLSKLTMHSSLTAEPFYRKHGYERLKEITHTLSSGVQMKAVMMAKILK